MARSHTLRQPNPQTDLQLMYKDMVIGEILEIRAVDARTLQEGIFHIRFMGFDSADIGDRSAIFRFSATKFWFHGDDPAQLHRVRRGVFALSGTSQTHIPIHINRMVGVGGIMFDNDYSFWNIDGTNKRLYVASVRGIRRIPPNQHWRVPTRDIQRFLKRVKDSAAWREEEWRRRDEEMRETNLTIKTFTGTTYLLSAEVNGERTLHDTKRHSTFHGKVQRLIPRYEMLFHCTGNDKVLKTSPVIGITQTS